MTTEFPSKAAATARVLGSSGWHLWEYDEVTSTNLIAATLEPWHAVRADTQTAGRGRFQRQWVSDPGGLWLSAVVPVETNSTAWRLLPLVAGLAVCEVLRDLGVPNLRLRWPNDVLSDNRKISGLLIDQFRAGRAVVGIGVNVANHPEVRDGKLNGAVTRLADFVATPPSLSDLAEQILIALKATWKTALDGDAAQLLPRINALWNLPRRVEVDLDGPILRGDFRGVDAAGRLLLCDDSNRFHQLEPQEVRLLRDTD